MSETKRATVLSLALLTLRGTYFTNTFLAFMLMKAIFSQCIASAVSSMEFKRSSISKLIYLWLNLSFCLLLLLGPGLSQFH